VTPIQLDLLAFAHFNAPAGLAGWHLHAARLLADWLVYLVPLSLALLWLSGANAAGSPGSRPRSRAWQGGAGRL
jgi:hypothetical protein